MPKILFVHSNFPAQFGFLGTRLAQAGWDVTFATARKEAASDVMRILPLQEGREITHGLHPYLANTERAVIKGQTAARVFLAARAKGYRPDIVMAHSGWGVGLFAKDVWPEAVFVPYAEWWYNYPPVDASFLSDFEPNEDNRLRQRIRNAPLMIDLVTADAALVPTEFQAAQFPAALRPQLTVIHDGVDTDAHAPAPQRPAQAGGVALADMAEIVTYATRGMEPQRGFPEFMRALAILLATRPNLHALIVGEDRVAYGRKLPDGDSWKTRMLAELDLDLTRVHFTGHLSRGEYLKVLQASDAHVYLTVPFVLSWSMLEAMSVGCPLVAADVAPVREFATAGETARLVDFHAPPAIAGAVSALLDDRAEARHLGQAARRLIVERYGLDRVFAEKKRWLEGLMAG